MSRTLANPPPPTSDNISFFPYPLLPLKVDVICVSLLMTCVAVLKIIGKFQENISREVYSKQSNVARSQRIVHCEWQVERRRKVSNIFLEYGSPERVYYVMFYCKPNENKTFSNLFSFFLQDFLSVNQLSIYALIYLLVHSLLYETLMAKKRSTVLTIFGIHASDQPLFPTAFLQF